MVTYLIIAVVIIAVLGFAYIDADKNGKISKEEIEELESKVERLSGYNINLEETIDVVLSKAVSLVEAIPVSQFKTVNKKLEKLGLELVRIDGLEGKKISSLQEIEVEETEE